MYFVFPVRERVQHPHGVFLAGRFAEHSAVTSRGFVEKDINDIVELIDTVLSAVAKYADVVNGVTEEGAEEYKAVLENVKRKVHNLTAGRPLNNY